MDTYIKIAGIIKESIVGRTGNTNGGLCPGV